MSLTKQRQLDLIETALGETILNYLLDDDVIEIMLNPDRKLWIDTLNEGRKYTGTDISPSSALRIINLVSSAVETVVNKNNPILSAELPGTGSRFQGMLPPTVANPIFTIRKKAIKIFTLDDYLERGSITKKQYLKVCKAVEDRKNILVVGGTSTGKTTFCNAIINEMAKYDNRIIILEDTQELQCSAEDVVFMRTTDNVTMRDLIKSTMRFRPDRIMIGEIRGGEALDLLKAWNSGHPGGVCTIHANDCKSGLEKLEQYIQEVATGSQEKLIASAVDIIITIKKLGTKRYIENIVELKNYNNDYELLKID
ncbi:P-type conjugative transfer ATPase TrbB [Ilyobacter sp.]|uniref:P-type conjugative transfer ATPase TrbB n=1 Tax=Ilyobacter sp. TaxID=3100343 RepID=UPI003561F526